MLKNGDAEEKFDYWCLDTEKYFNNDLKQPFEFEKIVKKYQKDSIRDGGCNDWSREYANTIDGWSIENNQNFAFEMLRLKNKLALNFVAGYFLKGKYQVIDLEEQGLTEEIMSKNKLKIEIFENYTRRNDCGCDYSLKVYLLSRDHEMIDSFIFNDKLEIHPCDWKHVSMQFITDDSKKPIRFIVYYHSGKVLELLC